MVQGSRDKQSFKTHFYTVISPPLYLSIVLYCISCFLNLCQLPNILSLLVLFVSLFFILIFILFLTVQYILYMFLLISVFSYLLRHCFIKFYCILQLNFCYLFLIAFIFHACTLVFIFFIPYLPYFMLSALSAFYFFLFFYFFLSPICSQHHLTSHCGSSCSQFMSSDSHIVCIALYCVR